MSCGGMLAFHRAPHRTSSAWTRRNKKYNTSYIHTMSGLHIGRRLRSSGLTMHTVAPLCGRCRPLAEFGFELAFQKVRRYTGKLRDKACTTARHGSKQKVWSKATILELYNQRVEQHAWAATFGRKSHVRSYIRDTIMPHSRTITWEPSSRSQKCSRRSAELLRLP